MDVLSSVFVTCDFSVLSFELCFEFSILCCVLCHLTCGCLSKSAIKDINESEAKHQKVFFSFFGGGVFVCCCCLFFVVAVVVVFNFLYAAV